MLYKLFLILCILLPFQIALNPTEGVDLASVRIFVLLLFFSCLAEGLKNKKLKIPFNIRTGLIFSFLFLNTFSVFVARNSDWSIRKLMFLFSIFPIYFVAVYLINSKKRLVTATKWIVSGGTLVAFLGIAQFLAQFVFGLERVYKFWADHIIVPFLGKTFALAVLQNPSWLVNISGKTYLRSTATFPDPHMLSFFLGIILSLALTLFLVEKKKFFYGSISLVLVIADMLTFSRGGYLGIAIGIIFLVVFFWKRIDLRMRIIFIAICFLVGLISTIPNPISGRYASIFNLREGSNMGRIEIWQKTLSIIENKPWIGVGIGNYSLEIKPTAAYREPFYAHNTYLDIAAETGVGNAFVWIGILFLFWRAFKRKAQKEVFFLGPALAIVIFATHSLVETAIYSSTVLVLFLIVLSFSNIKSDES